MFTLLRKVRKSLLESGLMQKYALYAIGEIALVVIGILLALQLNNWNEQRKDRIREREILTEIMHDIEVSKQDLERDVDIQLRALNSAEKLKNYMLAKGRDVDTLVQYMTVATAAAQFVGRTSGYSNLQSTGLNIIQNDSLRQAIVQLYDIRFAYTKSMGYRYDDVQTPRRYLAEYLTNHFWIDQDSIYDIGDPSVEFQFETNYLTLRDVDALLRDQNFVMLIQKSVYDRGFKISRYKRALRDIDLVIGMIEHEIGIYK